MLHDKITACRICAARFAATKTRHAPRPVAWFRAGTPVLIAGQAPGARVHESGVPFLDRSGDRLREWMGVDHATFYNRDLVSFLPTALCFPGYDARGSDLPPPKVCFETWHSEILDHIGPPRVQLIVGTYAIQRHLGRKGPLSAIIAQWRSFPKGTFVLPHPSWRNTGWLKKYPQFAEEVLPEMRAAIRASLPQVP
ncbi:MAG: uracil-DNA glycosylase family protein [Pseudomonadota bacterium]